MPERLLCLGSVYISTISLKSIDRSDFSNLRSFEMEGDTPEKHGIKSLDFQPWIENP